MGKMSKMNVDYMAYDKDLDEPILIEEAYLSNDKDYTIFRYADYMIRFQAPHSLEKYIQVKEWDNGYLVVMAKYSTRPIEEEEYIDLIPILENLYMNAEVFLKPIRQVEVRYA